MRTAPPSSRTRATTQRLRAELKARGIKAVIHSKPERRRALPLDRKLYRTRSLVECCFHELKRFRAIGTRYDKTKGELPSGRVHLPVAQLSVVVVVVVVDFDGDGDVEVDATVDESAKQHRYDVADTLGMLSFQRLDVYQRAIEFLALVYDVVDVLPRGHADRADQLTRAAESVVRNIAEGAGRWSEADSANRYKIARGEAMECAASLDVMKLRKVITDAQYARGGQLLEGVVAMLTKMV